MLRHRRTSSTSAPQERRRSSSPSCAQLALQQRLLREHVLSLEQRIRDFYMRYNPEKANKAPALARKYAADEARLFALLEHKYVRNRMPAAWAIESTAPSVSPVPTAPVVVISCPWFRSTTHR